MTGVRLPIPHLGARRAIRKLKRINYDAFGRRWQKTVTGMTLAHTGYKGYRGVLQGATILWGAPTFDQCRIAWNETEHAASGVADFAQSRMEATYPTGGKIIFRSLDDPDNARGHTADGVIIDEAAFVAERAWYEVIRPMISDTGGWALIMGTPRGHNWFWREWANASGDTLALQAPTLGVKITDKGLVRAPHPLENPGFPFSEAVRMYQTLPQRTFEQEFLAEFVEDAGGVFRGVMRVATLAEREPYAGQFVFGVDWGRSDDFTAVAVWDVKDKALVALDRYNTIDYVAQAGRLVDLYTRWQPSAIIAESNSMGQPLIDLLQRQNLPVQPFVTTNATKAAAIDGLALGIERGDVTLLNDPVLVSELQAYEMDRLPSGMMRYSAPEGMHDDTVMASAIGYTGVVDSGPLLLWGDE